MALEEPRFGEEVHTQGQARPYAPLNSLLSIAGDWLLVLAVSLLHHWRWVDCKVRHQSIVEGKYAGNQKT